jgi:uncharacterized protein (TIGR00251 family)
MFPKFLLPQKDGVSLAVKLQPRASSSEIGDLADDELRIRVTVPPVDAQANEALLRLLADTLNCPRGKAGLISGHTSRHKVVKVHGLTEETVLSKPRSA